MLKFFRLFLFTAFLISNTGCRLALFRSSNQDLLSRAEEALRQKDYESAVKLYRKHIDKRLKIEERPDWENPYFYLLMIGDVLLRAEKPKEALSAYQEADQKGVDKDLVSDRYRYLASWFEHRGELKEALSILSEYRERDPLLFDAMLDRIAKDLVKIEDQTPTNSATKSN